MTIIRILIIHDYFVVLVDHIITIIPSGKLTYLWKINMQLMGRSTISMAIFYVANSLFTIEYPLVN
jgi:hypothetical protein